MLRLAYFTGRGRERNFSTSKRKPLAAPWRRHLKAGRLQAECLPRRLDFTFTVGIMSRLVFSIAPALCALLLGLAPHAASLGQETKSEIKAEPVTLDSVDKKIDTTAGELTGKIGDAALAGHNAWMLTCAALVLFMTAPGLAMFYSGLVRKKNVLGVMMQCIFLMGLNTVIWALYGYSLSFGGTGAYIGNADYLFMRGVEPQLVETKDEKTGEV